MLEVVLDADDLYALRLRDTLLSAAAPAPPMDTVNLTKQVLGSGAGATARP